jgi:serine protease
LLCSVARSALAQQRSVVSALAQGHAYRHGVVPLLGGRPNGAAPTPGHRSASTAAGTGGNLLYNGGTAGVGVVTGAPRVYLVFWGSQWGSQGTDSNGDVTLSGDSLGMAPRLQEFMKGVGSNGETWSNVVTQYCQGVSLDAQTCPTGAAHVAYPSGGVLAGVWVDESSAAPFQANGHDIGLEAVNAAAHFANTDQAANASTQYVIVSPTGVHPDGFNTSSAQFCAWHDFTGDSSLSGGAVGSPYGQLAFTNLPYITDAGTPCGKDYVNSGAAGTLDGVTIVEGHEYAETLTDPYPATGWVDTSGSENADKCAWIAPGKPGGAQNITLSTGSFAVQSTWANDDNGGAGGCEISRPNIGN